jgi:hypothetical protein
MARWQPFDAEKTNKEGWIAQLSAGIREAFRDSSLVPEKTNLPRVRARSQNDSRRE